MKELQIHILMINVQKKEFQQFNKIFKKNIILLIKVTTKLIKEKKIIVVTRLINLAIIKILFN